MEKTKKEVHILYKKLGQTPFQAMDEYRLAHIELNGKSMTYAGRLDPMAEGLLLVLSGDEIDFKEFYIGLSKTYIFKILWGFETDTADVLGLLLPKKPLSDIVPEVLEIKNYLENSLGKFEQKYPAYSSKTVGGKPLFKWAREGRLGEVEIPKHEVEIFSAKYISRQEISGQNLLDEIISKINLVDGDFRQTEIKQKWSEVLNDKNKKLTLDTVELSVSGGFYVRKFVTDLAEHFQTNALAYHILRTKVGVFHI